MLIGQDRTGKTSLKRSLKGERFDANEETTSGIDLDPSQCIVTTEIWRTQQPDHDSFFDPTTTFERQVARLIVDDLMDAKETSRRTNEEPIDVTNNSQEHCDPPVSRDSLDTTREVNNTNVSDGVEGQSSSEPDMPDELLGLITTGIFEDIKTDDEEEIYSILWDFGGQLVYYVTHPLFLTTRAIYLLTYDLSRNPSDRASPPEKQGLFTKVKDSFSLETNFDYLDSWMSSVASLVGHDDGHDPNCNQSDNLPEKSPPVFLVCTHADQPYCDRESASLAAEIFGSLQGKSYSTHLFKTVFAVDNTKSGSRDECPEVKRLRREILAVAEDLPHTKEDIPLKWLKFEKELQAKVDGCYKWISFEDARQIAFDVCHISDEEEFLTLMKFLHDQRILIHFDDTPTLCKIVVLDIQWLIDVFKKVITVEPYDGKGKQYRELWLKLEKTGILDEGLLEHVWGALYKQVETSQSLIEIMEKFSLLCSWPSSKERKQYLVPSMLMSHPPEDVVGLVASSQIPSLYLAFNSRHVPTSLFPRMVLQFYQWCCEEWPNLRKPQLYRNFARFIVWPEEGCSVILLCHSSFIEVIAHRAKGVSDTPNSLEGDAKLSPSVTDHTPDVNLARAVSRQLGLMLECMRKEFAWLKNMECELKVLCSVCCRGNSVDYCRYHALKGCKQEHCLHFWSEADFAGGQQFVICDRAACACDPRLYIKQFSPWFTFLDEKVTIYFYTFKVFQKVKSHILNVLCSTYKNRKQIVPVNE